jgi:hypothetical protein
VIGAGDHDLVEYHDFRDKLGLLTANATTPYIIGFVNLARTGPLIIDVPEGRLRVQCSTSGNDRLSISDSPDPTPEPGAAT